MLRATASWRSGVPGTSVRVALVLCAAIVALCAPSAALASTGWSAPTEINNNNGLNAVSCPTSTFCVAVDQSGNALIDSNGVWSQPSMVDSNGGLGAISCSSASYCVAIDSTGHAVVYANGSWAAPLLVDSGTQGTSSVSCPASAEVPAPFCVAVDINGNGVIDQNGTWGAPTTISSAVALTSVSCPSASFCTAVGFGNSGGLTGAAVTYDGTSWSAPVTVANGGFLEYVSCPSSSFCAAAATGFVSGSLDGLAYTWNGTWSGPQTLSTAVGSFAASVSCASDTFCQEVYSSSDAAVFNGATWTVESGIDAGSNLSSVSCPVQEFCEAVDSSGDALTYTAPPPVPVNTVRPSIVNTNPTVGQQVSEVNGTWTNDPDPNLFTHQWEDCDSSGNSCVAISGATDRTYMVTASDAGHTLEVLETASNAGGTGSPVSSLPTAVVPAPVPTNSSPPSISGTAAVNQTLTETQGVWGNGPTAFAYQWLDCNPAGAACVAITGATDQSYMVAASDVGDTIRVAETASNSFGPGNSVPSAQTAVVPAPPPGSPPPSPPASAPPPAPAPLAPSTTAAPGLQGRAQAGHTLSAGTGTWLGTAPLAFAYQWQRCHPGCSPVPGATRAVYKLVAADVGARVRVLVTASNAGGQAQAASRGAGPVLPSSAAIRASLARQIKPGGAPAKIGELLTDKGFALSFRALSAGVIKVAWYDAPHGGRPALIATGTASVSRSRIVKVEIRLNRRGKRLLAHAKRLRGSARGTFTPSGAGAVRASRTFTLSS